MNRFCEVQTAFPADRGETFYPSSPLWMPHCTVCCSQLLPLNIPALGAYRRCTECGLMVDLSRLKPEDRGRMIWHYTLVDPHEEVAASKSGFYREQLQELAAHLPGRFGRLLDLGCGHGHFIEMAANAGWTVWGVDIVPEAVCAARKRVPAATVLEGDLRQAHLESGSLDAITLWDALDQFQDPAAEIEECRRILRRDGRIGIRVRNAASQLALYRLFQRSEWLWRKAEIKPPYAFHLFSFTRRSLHRLLSKMGFVDISIRNSPFTRGDPYGHSPLRGILETGKHFFGLCSGRGGQGERRPLSDSSIPARVGAQTLTAGLSAAYREPITFSAAWVRNEERDIPCSLAMRSIFRSTSSARVTLTRTVRGRGSVTPTTRMATASA